MSKFLAAITAASSRRTSKMSSTGSTHTNASRPKPPPRARRATEESGGDGKLIDDGSAKVYTSYCLTRLRHGEHFYKGGKRPALDGDQPGGFCQRAHRSDATRESGRGSRPHRRPRTSRKVGRAHRSGRSSYGPGGRQEEGHRVMEEDQS